MENSKQIFKGNFINALSLSRLPLLGIAVFLIILFHANIPAPDNQFLRILWNIFCNYSGGVGVSLFFLFSGFGLFISTFKDKNKITPKRIFQFYLKRIVRILPAYFIVAIIYYSFSAKSVDMFFYNLFMISFWSEGVRDFWFVAGILLLYLIFPVLWWFISKFNEKQLIPLLILFFVSVAIEFIIFYSSKLIYNRLEIFITRIPAFVLGLILGYCYLSKKFNLYLIVIIVSTIISIIFVILFAAHIIDSSNRSLRYLLTFFSVIIIALFSILVIYLPKFLFIPFDFLGKRTLEIYLIHVSWGNVWFRKITSNESLNIVIYIVLSLIVAEVLFEIANKKSNLWKLIKNKRTAV